MREYRIRNILVPTDFSPISRYGIHHAVRIARLTKAHITLLNVVEPLTGGFGTSGMLGAIAAVEERMQKTSAGKLETMARSLTQRAKISLETLSVAGRVAPLVQRISKETKADLIVMGTHGATGFVENLLGSNTYRVASLTRVPLLSVHKKMARYRHVVYPIRNHVHALDKFPQALMFARLFKASVHIIGLLRSGHRMSEQSMRSQCTNVQKLFARRGVEAEIEYTSEGFLPDVVMRRAHAYTGSLVVTVQDADFHLVEVFQGTFTKRVLHTMLSPVLTVPSRH